MGNPPYGGDIAPYAISYLSENYSLQQYQLDTYLLFLERSLKTVRGGGLVGFIIPNTWLLNLLSPQIRREILAATQIEEIVHYRKPVFDQAIVDTEIAIFKRQQAVSGHEISIRVVEKDGTQTPHVIRQDRWQQADGAPINIFERPEIHALADKLRSFPILDGLCVVTQGTKPFQVGKGKPPQTRSIVDSKPYVAITRRDNTFRPLLRGSLIHRYGISWDNDYWISFGDWLAEPRYSANYDAKTKIVVRQTGDSLVATLDEEQFIVRDNLYTILPRDPTQNLKFILGLLNSRLLNWHYQNVINPEKGEALAQVKRGHLASLPMPKLGFVCQQHDRMVRLVAAMLESHQHLAAARTERDTDYYRRKCDALDREIDALVYDLYGLTPEEIALVENSAPA